MIADEILAVFDAKNFGLSEPTNEAKNKMLSYMVNLDTDYGALIFPYYPSKTHVKRALGLRLEHTHNALDDAKEQALIFERMLEMNTKGGLTK